MVGQLLEKPSLVDAMDKLDEKPVDVLACVPVNPEQYGLPPYKVGEGFKVTNCTVPRNLEKSGFDETNPHSAVICRMPLMD